MAASLSRRCSRRPHRGLYTTGLGLAPPSQRPLYRGLLYVGKTGQYELQSPLTSSAVVCPVNHISMLCSCCTSQRHIWEKSNSSDCVRERQRQLKGDTVTLQTVRRRPLLAWPVATEMESCLELRSVKITGKPMWSCLGRANGKPERRMYPWPIRPPEPSSCSDTPTRRLAHYLVGVVHQGAIITVISHAVAVGVSLVSIVHIGTIVSLIEDICRHPKGTQGNVLSLEQHVAFLITSNNLQPSFY